MSFYFLLILIVACVGMMAYISYKSHQEYEHLKEGDHIRVYDGTNGFFYNCTVIISEGKKCYMDRNTGKITPFNANDLFRGDVSTQED